MRALSLFEGRVLGVLVEKAHTVPDSYPLSLNALVSGCNQKTARDPVLTVDDDDVLAAVDGLKTLHLLFESSGSRVVRYQHNMARALGLPSQSVALLATLLLRGPQTGAELRANADRLHRFADASSVDGFLDELAARVEDKGGPLVVKLARMPGAREPRWAQLLCGPVDAASLSITGSDDDTTLIAVSELAAITARQTAMQREIDALVARVERLYQELGVSDGSGTGG